MIERVPRGAVAGNHCQEGNVLGGKETLVPSVEIRLVNWEKDAGAIAEIWNNPDIIKHLAGVAPAVSYRNISKFRANIAKYIPSLSSLPEEELRKIAEQIIIATPAEIEAFYAKYSNIEVYVAVAKEKIKGKDAERIVGTVSLEKPIKPGDRMGAISKLAVSPDAPSIGGSTRGKGIGRRLIGRLNNRMFDPRQLGLWGATATIMQRVDGELAPAHLFQDAGYDSTGAVKFHLGWNPELRIFEERRVTEVQCIARKTPIAS